MQTSSLFNKKWLTDIRFWILLFFILRLYGITNAPLEMGHNWRQSLTNTIARNFLQMDNNILYPRVDMSENGTGIMATEFPFFNYLIYLIAKIFGYAHWYGRLINLFVSSIGIFYFYKIIKRFFTESLAFYTTLILLSSLWFAYSRKTMPDTFCMSLVIIGIYFGLNYLYEKKILNLVLFFLFSSLAILCKIPALYLLSVLIIPMFDKEIKLSQKISFCIASIFVLLIMYTWYFYWDPYLLTTYGVQLYFPQGLFEGLKEIIALAPDTLVKFYFIALESFVAFAFFLVGLFLIFKQKKKLLISVFLISSFVFLLFMCKTGYVFSTHSYYIVPYVPIMALITAFALEQIKNNKIKIAITFVIIVEAFLNQQDDFRIRDSEKYKLQMESVADKISTRKDLIAINGGQSPQEIYFLNRRGWSVTNEELSKPSNINSWKEKGCKYVFIDKHIQNTIDLSKTYKVIYSDEDFVVYTLQN